MDNSQEIIDYRSHYLEVVVPGLGRVEICAPNGIGRGDDGVRLISLWETDEMWLSHQIGEGGVTLGEGLKRVLSRLNELGARVFSGTDGCFVHGEGDLLCQVSLTEAVEQGLDAIMLGPICFIIDFSRCLPGNYDAALKLLPGGLHEANEAEERTDDSSTFAAVFFYF